MVVEESLKQVVCAPVSIVSVVKWPYHRGRWVVAASLVGAQAALQGSGGLDPRSCQPHCPAP